MHIKYRILSSIIIFIITYTLFLFAWLYVKSYYGYWTSSAGAHIAAKFNDLTIDNIIKEAESFTYTFIRPIYSYSSTADLVMDVTTHVSNYSFNLPLTLALLSALYPMFRVKKMWFMEAILILVCIHMCYTISFFTYETYKSLASYKVINTSSAQQLFIEFIWSFVDNMVIRFEPFILVIYLWFRNAKSKS